MVLQGMSCPAQLILLALSVCTTWLLPSRQVTKLFFVQSLAHFILQGLVILHV